ncbi:hypothetical protein K4S59_05340 [Staphylococcus epidermidis]|nr:hypothetical protein [Staphylococcus epidermidis]
MEEWHNVVKNLNKLLHLLHDALKERDSFCKQRDELINDMSEIKKKAEAFDLISNSYTTEIEQAIKNKELNQCLFLLEQILDDLEVDHEG